MDHWLNLVMKALHFLVVATILVYAQTSLAADVYRWTDKSGAVHYTDAPSNVPEGRLESIEEIDTSEYRKSEPSDKTVVPLKPRTNTPNKPLNNVIVVPLLDHGLSYYVETKINGSVSTNLLLDTGASITVISRQLASKIGYKNVSKLPKIPVTTAGGISWIYLVKLKSLNVGKASVTNVECGISDNLGGGLSGLLGASFLNGYIYQIDTPNKVLLLKTPSDSSAMHGAHGKNWWVAKYRRYVSNIKQYKSLRRKVASGVTAVQDRDVRYAKGLGVNEIKKVEDYYRDLLRDLERKASTYGVPMEWRMYP